MTVDHVVDRRLTVKLTNPKSVIIMKNVIDIETEVLGTETRAAATRSWFNTLASVLWTVLVVLTFPIRILFRPVTSRVIGYTQPRWESFKKQSAIVTIARFTCVAAAAWMLFLLTSMMGFHPSAFAKETGKRTQYWGKQTVAAVQDGELVEAAGASFNYVRNAKRPNAIVRAGSAIGNFFK